MMLREAIERYILWRQAHGAKFVSDAGVLRRFLGYADGDAACDAVTKAQVLAFLAGKGPLTRYRENKYCALGGFWRYAISRDLASRSPLPDNEPRSPVRAPPYIYSRDELRRLFDPATVAICRHGARQLDAITFRTLLVLLYGAGLRFGDAARRCASWGKQNCEVAQLHCLRGANEPEPGFPLLLSPSRRSVRRGVCPSPMESCHGRQRTTPRRAAAAQPELRPICRGGRCRLV
jgi:hypothetical protein